MVPSPIRGSPSLESKGLVSSNGVNNNQMPRLVAPQPIHPGPFPITHFDSNRSGQSNSIAENDVSRLDEQEQRKVSSTSRPPSSLLRALADPDAVLPVQGDEDDVVAAVEKLERMRKISQTKRHWVKRTGYEGLAMIATAGGKNSTKADRKRDKQEAKDDDSVSSVPLFGEVKLGISSLPGYTVLAAQKAKFHLGKANTEVDVIGDNQIDKDKFSMEPGDDERGSIRKTFSLRRGNKIRQRKGSSTMPEIEQKQKSPDLNANVQGESGLLFTPLKEDVAVPSMAAGPSLVDLKSVKEEPRSDEIESTSRPASLSLKTDNLKSSKTAVRQKPRLMVQSPSEGGLEIQTIPESQPVPSHPASVLSSHSETEENCAADAEAAVDACIQNVSRSSFQSPGDETMQDYMSSSSSASSDGQGSASDSEGSDVPVTQQEEYLLNLEHGEELTKKQKKKLLRRMRHSKSGGANMEDSRMTGLNPATQRQHKRTGSLSNRVQLGLHYASSQSRNRRAMERYSPHPSRPNSTAPQSSTMMYPGGKPDSAGNLSDLLASSRANTYGVPPTEVSSLAALADISRSSTPVLDQLQLRDIGPGSRRSSMSERDRVLPFGNENGDASFCVSPVAESAIERGEDRWADLSRFVHRRQGTANSITSSLTGNPSFRKKYLSLRRRKQNTSDVVEESDSDHQITPKEDAEKELDNVLGKLIAQQAPDELKEMYEYDVLYENQRGLMVFGIPKFSAKTLFQWDPDPWTNAYNGNSAYNIVNAQLPDPSWEWVHQEWLIDMSGDVDESGWQYSYNFGRFTLPLFTRPSPAIPRANAHNNQVMNERMAKKVEKRQEKEKNREDDGFEALKRTARARGAKWTGIPDQNKYVRRRRWIRLRRRKAVHHHATAANTPSGILGTPLEMGKASGDWSQLVEEEKKKRDRQQAKAGGKGQASEVSSDDDESLSDLESDEADSSFASDDAGSSTFLPRQTPGNLLNGPDATQLKAGKEQRRQKRHAREFTGTIRELKSLLPAILDRRHHNYRTSNRQRVEKELWLSDVDARNPYISWNYVKKRLDDDDLAFASTSLRARERKHAQKMHEQKQKLERKRIPSSFASEGKGSSDVVNYRDDHSYELTKDALVEINFRRVMRVMRACKVDRQKLLLWKIWLGVEPVSSITEVAREEDLAYTGLGINAATTTESLLREKKDALRQARGRWRKAFSTPEGMDVWDLLERRLDRILLTFEYQGSRATLLRLLLTIHATSHPSHKFKQSHWSIEADHNQSIEPNAPSSLSPEFGNSKEVWKADVRASAPAGDEWRAVNLPRLEFWSDLEKCARSLLEGTLVASPLLDDNTPSPSLQEGGEKFAPTPQYHPASPTQSTQPLTGSLANGPTARRFTNSSAFGANAPPSFMERTTNASPSSKSQRLSSPTLLGEPDDRDRKFLAQLLHLPAQSQRELLVKTAEQSNEGERGGSSSLVQKLTMAAEEEGDF